MTPSQPLRALTAAASPAPPSGDETSRLLRLWADLAYRASSAYAHHSSEEPALRRLQLQVEDALTQRVTNPQALITDLQVWESGLIHVAQETPPETCLICRRARLGLPLELPFPAATGGTR
jgi:hypothetical protein